MAEFTQAFNGVLGILIGVFCLILVLAVIFTVVRYVAETSAIRMVDRMRRVVRNCASARDGAWAGRGPPSDVVDRSVIWSWRSCSRLIDLCNRRGPLLLWLTQNEVAGVVGTVATVGLGVLAIVS